MHTNLLSDSSMIYTKNFLPILFIILPIAVPIEIFSAFYQDSHSGDEFNLFELIIPTALWGMGYPIYTAGFIFYIASTLSGERISTRTAWTLGIKYWLPFVIMGSFILLAQLFGLMLLIIPGIIISIRYSFSVFFLLLNERAPLNAMKDSWEATKEYFWLILSGYAALSTLLFIPYSLIGLSIDESGEYSWLFTALLNIALTILTPLYTTFAFHVYKLAKAKHL